MQEKGSGECLLACLAMLKDWTLEEARDWARKNLGIKRWRGHAFDHALAAMDTLGCRERALRVFDPCSIRGARKIAEMRPIGRKWTTRSLVVIAVYEKDGSFRNSHCVVCHNGTVYDPSFAETFSVGPYLQAIAAQFKLVVHFWPVPGRSRGR